jgi:GAF domain-containing protein
MTKVTDSERCSVFIHDPERDKVWLKAGTGVGEHEIEVPKEGSIVGQVIASGEPVVVADLDTTAGTHKEVDEQTGFVTRNILCVPIKSPTRNEVTGAFQLLNKMNGQEFTDEDVALAEEIAEHLQVEVDGIFLDQEIIRLSERLYSAAKNSQ